MHKISNYHIVVAFIWACFIRNFELRDHTLDQHTLERILDLSSRMAETRALKPLLEYAMDEAMKLVGAERGYIVLLTEGGTLDFRVMRSVDSTPMDDAQDQISTTILDKVIITGQPIIIRDASADPELGIAKSVSQLKLRSVMCVPLIARGEVIGALYVENRTVRGRFSEGDQFPLTIFANQAAVAIENAALNDDLEARVAERTRELEFAKADVERSWADAVEANRLRTTMLGNLTHDFRSPLSIVIESLQLLEAGIFGDLNTDQLEWVSKALEASRYVLNLTNDVFDLTKIEVGGLALYKQDVCLSEFLDKSFRTAQGLLWPPSVALDSAIPPDLPCMSLDPVRISQILLNLFSNAHKYTSEGTVTLYAEHLADQDAVLIGIKDTGGGIDPAQVDKLFQRFQQMDKNRERRRLGTGLGLAISRELVEMHGGRIWLDNHPSEGADFKFILPTR